MPCCLFSPFRFDLPRAAAFACTLLIVSVARAETDPYVLSVTQAFSADTNLFRAPEGAPVSRDIVSSTGVRLGVDQPFGRQRFSAGLGVNLNRYKNNTQLNNTDHQLSARLDWATVERVSGELSVEQRESLYRYDLDSQSRFTAKNVLRTTGAALQARVGVVTQWTLEAGWAGNQSQYSADAFSNRDVRQQILNAGVRWSESDAMSVRLGGRYSEGRFPNFGVEPDAFRRNDFDLSTVLKPNGVSTINARASVTSESHSVQSQRDVSTWTGDLGWNWQPTGKLNVELKLSRDSSVGSSSYGTALNLVDSSDTRVSRAVQLNARWEASAKIQVTARLASARRNLDNAFISGGAVLPSEGRDRTDSFGLSVRYQPLRSVELGCDVGRERRLTDADSLAVTYPYRATTASCYGQFSLR